MSIRQGKMNHRSRSIDSRRACYPLRWLDGYWRVARRPLRPSRTSFSVRRERRPRRRQSTGFLGE